MGQAEISIQRGDMKNALDIKRAVLELQGTVSALESLVMAIAKRQDELNAEMALEKERHGTKRTYQRRGSPSAD